jgi:SOS-response transcriptional repressor LexA
MPRAAFEEGAGNISCPPEDGMNRRKRDDCTLTVRLSGSITCGEPIDRSGDDKVQVPSELFDDGEELYRMQSALALSNIQENDFLIVEPRPEGDASTGELVLVEYAGRAYVGRWWRKRGRRALLDETKSPIVEGPHVRVLGAVTMIVRWDMP